MCSQSNSPQVNNRMSANGEDRPAATVLITTKDRKVVLCQAIDSIPYSNHWPDGTTQPPAPVPGRESIDFPGSFVYPGGSNAKRRQLFVELGGYSGVGRQSEEPTYAIRLLDHEYVVRVSSNVEIDHYPQRAKNNCREIMYAGPAFLGLARGIWEGSTRLQARRPVAPSTYRLMRRMTNHPLPCSQIEPELRPIVLDNDLLFGHPP